MSVTLTATPEEVLLDEPVRIRVEGLSPGRRATVRASFRTEENAWRGRATFEADDEGRIDLTRREPVDGDYEGVRPMGLVQFARPDDVDDDRGSAASGDVRPLDLSVAVDGDECDRTTVHRRRLAEGAAVRPVDDEVVGDLLVPPGEGPHPGVVLLGGSGGGVPTGPRAKLLASRGYAVLAAAYFQAADIGSSTDEGHDTDHLPERLESVPVEYAERAVEWFRDRPEVRSDPVGVVGGSRGSELAFMLGARLDAVRAVVASVPSGYRFAAPTREGGPAWTADGDPLPYLENGSGWRMFLRVFRAKFARADAFEMTPTFRRIVAGADGGELAAATIPVEDVGGPVLLLSGGDDRLWPSRELADAVVERLDERGYGSHYEHVAYDDAGHAIAVPYLPVRDRSVGDEPVLADLPLALGGSPEGYADADRDSWERTLVHLDRGLGGDAAEGLRAATPD